MLFFRCSRSLSRCWLSKSFAFWPQKFICILFLSISLSFRKCLLLSYNLSGSEYNSEQTNEKTLQPFFALAFVQSSFIVYCLLIPVWFFLRCNFIIIVIALKNSRFLCKYSIFYQRKKTITFVCLHVRFARDSMIRIQPYLLAQQLQQQQIKHPTTAERNYLFSYFFSLVLRLMIATRLNRVQSVNST